MNDFQPDFQDSYNQDTLGHLAAISQRNKSIAQQKEVAEAIRKQTAVLEATLRNEADRTKIEQQRLHIEKQRLKEEEADREMRRQQEEQIKQLRNLIADSFDLLGHLHSNYPAK